MAQQPLTPIPSSGTMDGLETPQESGSVAPKPFRLRAACNQCHAAKVRCSGHKDGCTRCNRAGLACQYQLSMVGRSSSKRHRAGRSHHRDTRPQRTARASDDTPEQVAGKTPNTSSSSLRQVLPASLPTTPPLVAGGDAVLRLDDMGDSAGLEFAAPHLFSTHDGMSGNDLGDWGEPFDLSRLDIADTVCNRHYAQAGIIEERPASFTWPDHTTPHPLLPDNRARSKTAVSESWHDCDDLKPYPHAAALSSLIDRLERCLQMSTPTLDKIMSVNRKAMSSLPTIMAMGGFRQCHSCPSLVATILDLILRLYCVALDSAQSDPADSAHFPEHRAASSAGSQQSQGFAPESMHLPPDLMAPDASSGSSSNASSIIYYERPLFRFGCLEFEPGEQGLLRDIVLRKDLLKCLDTIRSCHSEWETLQDAQRASCESHSVSGRKNAGARGRPRSEELRYQEMRERAEELLASLKPQDL